MRVDSDPDGRYLRSNPGYHVDDSPWKASHVLKLLSDLAIEPKRIVEIGCGAGEVLRVVRDALPSVERLEGWDVSADAIRLARSRADERTTFHHGDLLDSGAEPFDLVLCLDVVEHVEDYLGFLRRVRALGRRFIFHFPLDLSVQSVARLRPILVAREKTGHLHYFTKETALASLEMTGYRVDEWRYTAGALDRPDKSVLQRLARLPRRAGFALSPDLTVRILGGFSLLALASPA